MDLSAIGSFVTSRRLLWAVTVLAALWTAGSLATSWVESSGLAAPLRLIYQPVCHQIPERCVTVAGQTAAVCARCTGLYLGGTLGLLMTATLYGRLRAPSRIWLAVAVAPSLIDFVSGFVGGPSLENVPRLLVAVPAGMMLGWFLGEGLSALGGSGPVPWNRRAAIID